MNFNLSSKPHVTINLSPALEAYCRYIFRTPVKQGCIILHRRHNIGKVINSNWSVSDLPVKRPFCDNPVTFILPITKQNHYALRGRFYYVSKLGEHQIQDWIAADFDQWCTKQFLKGERKGWSSDKIITAILRGLNVRNNAINYEAVKKNDYRKRRTEEQERFEELICDCMPDI